MSKIQTKEKTENKTKKNTEERKWFLVDADGLILGRMSTRIAPILMGKNKVGWQPNMDSGDYVIIVNAKNVKVTGRKEEDKKYYRYSGYPGGLREENLKKLRSRKPEEIIYSAIRGMMPKTRLGRAMIKKLFVYAGSEHPHEAQKPEEIEV